VDSPALSDGAGVVAVGGEPFLLRPERVLHAGSPFDRDRLPSALERAVVTVVGGAHHEVRWQGTVVDGSGAAGPGLWEEVRFGAAARAAR
jgi:hypothetical protein